MELYYTGSRPDHTPLPETLPESLVKLTYTQLKLKALPANLPPHLKKLNCSQNHLQTLPDTLPPTLQYLQCDFNRLQALPDDLPATLQNLICNVNRLTHLPQKISTINLISLICCNNNLTSLPPLPPTLNSLHCQYNQLRTLTPLPASLVFLKCNDNYIQYIPTLPVKICYIDCSCNHLKMLPDLPEHNNTNYAYHRVHFQNFMPDIRTRHYDNLLAKYPKIKSVFYANFITYINETNSQLRTHQRTMCIKSQITEAYARKTMNPVNLQPLLDDKELDVDDFMDNYVNGL